METGTGRSPSPREARETLQQLTEDTDAVRYPPLPRCFFPVQAVLVAGIALAQLLPSAAGSAATVACGMVSAVLGGKYWLNREGESRVSVSFADMVPFLLGLYGILGLCWALSAATGARWIWVVGAVVVAGIVVRTGHTYRMTYGDA